MKVIVVGCGSMGRRRVLHAKKLAGAEVGIWDIRRDRMKEVVDLYAATPLNGIESFSAFGPDAVFVCVPPADHETYMDWALENGISFMVEQPISHKLENLDRILAAVREKELTVHVSNNHLFSAETAAMKTVMDSGELGRPLTAIFERGEWLPDWHPHEPYTDYYPSSRDMGGGLDAVCEMGWLRELFGEVSEAKSLCSRKSDLDIDTYDVSQFLFEFSGGVQVSMHLDMLQREYASATKIIFEKGVLTHKVPDRKIMVFNAETSKTRAIPFDDRRDDHDSMKGKGEFNFMEPMYERDSGYFFDRLKAEDTGTESLEEGIAILRTIHPLVDGME